MKRPSSLSCKRPEDAALDGLEAVREVGDGAVANDIGGVVEKAAVHAAMERQLDLAGHEGTRRRRHGDILGQDMRGAVAALGGLAAWAPRRCRLSGRAPR